MTLQEKRERGLCRNCTRPVVPGRTSCARCLESRRKHRRKCREEATKHGFCWDCGRPPVEGQHRCARCQRQANARNHKRYAAISADLGSYH